ncbi:hypothetical protein PoB_006419800 [Plakobranchus ocellatus]|uniref:Uncharacterized protein n=1 Tax=Plakobranchus ocellatus TaxID=259542 RepID=A0AAV4D0H9_9GAST|nr:hypothetical protein PoB_006419800 [Plakobranchus ocellatus]
MGKGRGGEAEGGVTALYSTSGGDDNDDDDDDDDGDDDDGGGGGGGGGGGDDDDDGDDDDVDDGYAKRATDRIAAHYKASNREKCIHQDFTGQNCQVAWGRICSVCGSIDIMFTVDPVQCPGFLKSCKLSV